MSRAVKTITIDYDLYVKENTEAHELTMKKARVETQRRFIAAFEAFKKRDVSECEAILLEDFDLEVAIFMKELFNSWKKCRAKGFAQEPNLSQSETQEK